MNQKREPGSWVEYYNNPENLNDYEIKVQDLIKKYRGRSNLVWDFSYICTHADKRGLDLEKTVSHIVETMSHISARYSVNHFEPELKHIAGAFYLAAQDQNMPCTKSYVAEEFGVNQSALNESIKQAEKARDWVKQMQFTPV